MKRSQETALLDFCHQQKGSFDERAWKSFGEASSVELATVATYLAGVEWFGNQEKLRRIAGALLGGKAKSFPDLARETRFEPSRFAGLLKARLAYASNLDAVRSAAKAAQRVETARQIAVGEISPRQAQERNAPISESVKIVDLWPAIRRHVSRSGRHKAPRIT